MFAKWLKFRGITRYFERYQIFDINATIVNNYVKIRYWKESEIPNCVLNIHFVNNGQ